MLNSQAVFNLYTKNPTAKSVLDYMTLRGRNEEKFYVDILAKDLRLDRSDIIQVFKGFEKDCKMGGWLRGRVTPGQTRFESVYRMDDVEKAMHNSKFEALEPYRASPKRELRVKKKKAPIKVVAKVVQKKLPALENPPMHKDAAPILKDLAPIVMNVLVIRPGFVLQIPSGLSEAERKKVRDFLQIAN